MDSSPTSGTPSLSLSVPQKLTRMPWDEYYIRIAHLISQRGTCVRRRVGCVLVNRHNQILSTGYNGPPAGEPHCIEKPCAGASAPSGQGLELCEAIHAEQNALLQCADVHKIEAVYCTDGPCMHCVKMLMNTSAARIVFLRPYSHPEASKRWAGSLTPFTGRAREWLHYPVMT